MSDEKSDDSNSIVWSAVQAIAISSEKAEQIANQYKNAARKSNPKASDLDLERIVSKKVISKYARHSSLSGGVCALPGIIPGVGTAVAMVGGGVSDATFCLKSQIDMTLVLASNFGWDVTEHDARHMAMVIAVSGGLEKLGVNTAAPIASKAGVNMVKMYFKGASLTAAKALFKSFGVTFTRKSIEKSLPFGIGVVMGSSLNYALTHYVGREAVKFFTIEKEMREASV